MLNWFRDNILDAINYWSPHPRGGKHSIGRHASCQWRLWCFPILLRRVIAWKKNVDLELRLQVSMGRTIVWLTIFLLFHVGQNDTHNVLFKHGIFLFCLFGIFSNYYYYTLFFSEYLFINNVLRCVSCTFK